MIHEMQNWALMDLTNKAHKAKVKKMTDEVKAGDIIIKSNLAQFKPDTEVFKGIKDLVIIDCNIVNCKFDSSTKVHRGNNAKIDYEYVDAVVEEEKEPIKTLNMKQYLGKQECTKIKDEDLKIVLKDVVFTNKEVKNEYDKLLIEK